MKKHYGYRCCCYDFAIDALRILTSLNAEHIKVVRHDNTTIDVDTLIELANQTKFDGCCSDSTIQLLTVLHNIKRGKPVSLSEHFKNENLIESGVAMYDPERTGHPEGDHCEHLVVDTLPLGATGFCMSKDFNGTWTKTKHSVVYTSKELRV